MSIKLDNQTKEIINKIIEKILNSEQITITTHLNPDGDAIGSSLALYLFIKSLSKNVRLIIHDEVPYNFKFLKHSDEIEQYGNENIHYIQNSDLIIVVDLNDVKRTKAMSETLIRANANKIIIDHHIDPKEFAELYLVNTEATSTGELIYYLITHYNKELISSDIANALYSAIATDTGNFRFPRTDEITHQIISDLISKGADPVNCYEQIYNNRPVRFMKLLGEAFCSIETYFDNTVCIMTLTEENYSKADATELDVEDIVEQSMSIANIKVGILLSESNNGKEIRCSFRSKGDLSVRDFAVKFNGGGHKNASGARFKNKKIDEVKHIIIEELKEFLK